jgi:hypothetical protein
MLLDVQRRNTNNITVDVVKSAMMEPYFSVMMTSMEIPQNKIEIGCLDLRYNKQHESLCITG